MKILYKYAVWLTPAGVEKALRGEEITASDFNTTNPGVPMENYGYYPISEGELVFDFIPCLANIAAFAVNALKGEIDEERKKFDKRVSELLDQIRKFEALTFNPTTGNAE